MLNAKPVILVCMLVVAAVNARAGDPPSPSLSALNQAAIDGYIIPRLEILKEKTGRLASQLAMACSGEERQLGAVQERFARTVTAWAEVEFLRFGPMAVDARPERFSFWPDPRGVVVRQMRRAIARKDPDVLDPVALGKKSVAIQGLPALEALLTSKKHAILGDSEKAQFRCDYAKAIAQNLNAIASDVLNSWTGPTGWREMMLNPASENPHYKSVPEASAELVRAQLTGLQIIQDRIVVPLITAEEVPGKKARLPFAPSGLSGKYVAASIAGNKAYFEALGLERFIPKTETWMSDWMTMAFRRLEREAPLAVEEYGKGKPGDPERVRSLRILRFHVNGLRSLIGRKIVPAMGLVIGFNELDGD